MKCYGTLLLGLTLAVIGCGHGTPPATTGSGGPAKAGTPAPPPAGPDTSLTVEEYKAQGMPDIDKPWTPDDYDKAEKALEKIAKADGGKLPRAGSAKSGAVAARIFFRDNLPTSGMFRSQDMMSISQAARRIQSHYFDNNALRDQAATIVELEEFKLYVARQTMQALAAMAAGQGSARKVAASNRDNYTPVAASEMKLLGTMLADTSYFSAEDRARLADSALEHGPELLSFLKPDELSTFRGKVTAAAGAAVDPQLKAKLDSVAAMQPVEIKVTQAPLTAAAKAAGQDSPENALKATIRAMRDGDCDAFIALTGQDIEGGESFFTTMEAYDKPPPELRAMLRGYKLRDTADNWWAEGRYKVFPAEIEGDKAVIVIAGEGRYDKTLRHNRYYFRKLEGKWYWAGNEIADEKTLDKAKYAWDQKPAPDWAEAGPKDLMPPPAARPKPDFTLTAAQLGREFADDAKKAAAKYVGKWIQLDGKMSGPCEERIGYPIPFMLTLEANEPGVHGRDIIPSPGCEITYSQRRAARGLKTNQHVTVLGQCREHTAGLLVDCRIVSAGPDPSVVLREEPVVRTWSDATGKFKMEAVYLGAADGKVQLKKNDGKTTSIPEIKLSVSDRVYLIGQKAWEAAKGAPPPDAKHPPALANIKFEGEGWKGEFNNLGSWDFDKYTPGSDGFNEKSGGFSVGSPTTGEIVPIDDIVVKLKKEKDFCCYNELWTEVTDKGTLPDGFYVLGTSVDVTEKKPKPRLALFAIRNVGGTYIRSRSSDAVSPEIRLEMLQMFATARAVAPDAGKLNEKAALEKLSDFSPETGTNSDARISRLSTYGNHPMTDEGMALLESLTALEELAMHKPKITNAGMAHVAALPLLTRLEISKANITDAGLKPLAGLKNLKYLDLEETQVTDAGLDTLSQLPSLTTLDLSGTKVTEAGLKKIKKFPELKLLTLKDMPIGDAGVANLEGCPKLDTLIVIGSKVTAKGQAKFKELFPDATIVLETVR